MKKIIKKILRNFNIDIKRIHPELKNSLSFDEIYIKKIKQTPIIFDVGANQGQSIKRFKKMFPNCLIHSFEPIKSEYSIIKERYGNDKNVFINNFALGDKSETKDINVTAKSGNSSFNTINQNTDWLRVRSKQNKTSETEYVKFKEEVQIITLDKYCQKNLIKENDILKVDTQGYEDKVLEGSNQMLEKNMIHAVELELMFDNVYNKYLNFSDVEKYLIPNNFRLCALRTANENLFEGLVFFADVIYFNKNKFNL